MPKTLPSAANTVNPSLLAFKPRQVLLSKPDMKETNSNGLNPEQKAHLLLSVARFLENNGFSRTLKKFRSEADIKTDALKGSLLDLEQVFIKMWNAEETTRNSRVEELNVKAKEKKKNKKDSDQAVKQVDTEELKVPDPLVENPEKNLKEKKKNKLNSELESRPIVLGEKVEDGPTDSKNVIDSEIQKKTKNKEKKKKKQTSDSVADNVDSQAVDLTVSGANNSQIEDKSSKSKTKKKKKDDLALESYCGEETKISKKRKRLDSDESEVQAANKIDTEESKGGKKTEQANLNGTIGSNHIDNFHDNSIEKLDGQANGNMDKSAEKSSVQKSAKKQKNGSVEPKTVNPFQRVKAEEVVFVDERLKDNSYWAKDGADIGYGAKAQEVLGQVRGRDFRHEKTKKKRGSYRGGQIDQQSYSVKFNYSDEE
ncbi:hypothetical protein UlMin_004706 [Ulmus minor]